MGIDYEGLYARDYFGHGAGVRSFQPRFPELLAGLARSLGCGGVLDVGSGNGELTRVLRSIGLAAVPLDLRGDDEAGVLPMDLTTVDPGQLDRVRSGSRPRLEGSAHLATCLDVLEHIDRPNLAAALWNLRELSDGWLLVSVSTRPSSRDNLYHATVAPPRTWRKLFEAAGFEIHPHSALEGMPSRLDYPHEEPYWCLHLWRRIDPFGDNRGPEPCYLLLRKRPGALTPEALADRAGLILDLPATGPATGPSLDPETHLTFVVGHYQDFHHYRPFWDAIDRRAVRVLIRSGPLQNIHPMRHRAILAYLRSRGIDHQEVQSVGEVDWLGVRGSRRALVVATESTALDTHLLNASFVLGAQSAGYKTFQIQHGIWPHADFSVPVVFTSEHVLTWSNEFRDGFAGHAIEPVQSTRPGDPTRFTVTGCPKFDGNADPRPISTADLLGDWAEAYDRSILLATNLQWAQHLRGSEVVPSLLGLAHRNPETLFLCKLHPVHDVDESLLDQLPANFRILDEFACLFADLLTPRLIRATDAVISTPSTIVLEAGLAKKPFAVIDTGNPNRFVGVEPVAIEALDDALKMLLSPHGRAENLTRHEPFVDHYYDRNLLGRGLGRVIEAIEADLSGPESVGATLSPMTIAARAFSASFSGQFLPRGRERLAEAERKVAHLEGELARSLAQLEALRGQLQQAEDRHRAERDEALGHREAVESELRSTRVRLDQAHERLEPLSDLGPSTIRVARGLGRLSRRHPRVSVAIKAVARRGLRFLKP